MDNPIAIRLCRLPHGAGLPLPVYATAGAAGMDVVAAEALTLAPGARADLVSWNVDEPAAVPYRYDQQHVHEVRVA